MADTQTLATIVRNLISERSPASVNVTIPHIIGCIRPGLEAWTRIASKDPDKIDFFEEDFSIPLVAGVLDLTNYINGTTAKISLKDLRSQTVYTTISGERTPFTWVGSYMQLKNGRYPSDQPALFLDNNTLRTRNVDGSLTSLGTASIEFHTVNIPSTAEELPEALVGDAANFLADYVTKELLVDGPARRR